VCRPKGPLDRASLRDALTALYVDATRRCERQSCAVNANCARSFIRRSVVEQFRDLSDAPDARRQAGCATRLRANRAGAVHSQHHRCGGSRAKSPALHQTCNLDRGHGVVHVLQRELAALTEQLCEAVTRRRCRGGYGSSVNSVAIQRARSEEEDWRNEILGVQMAGECPPEAAASRPSRGRGACAARRRSARRQSGIQRRLDSRPRDPDIRPPVTILLAVTKLMRKVTGQDVPSTMSRTAPAPSGATVGFVDNLVLLRTRLEGVSTFADVRPDGPVGRVGAWSTRRFG